MLGAESEKGNGECPTTDFLDPLTLICKVDTVIVPLSVWYKICILRPGYYRLCTFFISLPEYSTACSGTTSLTAAGIVRGRGITDAESDV